MESADHFADLYARARAGEVEARGEILLRLRPPLCAFLERRMGREVRRLTEIDDLYQQAALALLRALSTYPVDLSEEELTARAVQLAKWKIAGVLDKRIEAGESALSHFEAPSPHRTTGEVTKQDEIECLGRAIERLKPEYGLVVRLRVFDNASVEEIAALIGLSSDAVEKRISRAKAELSRLLRQSERS